jgi:cytochrome c biogenesis factor
MQEKRNEFIQLVEKNLRTNGFPAKKVAFDVETIYEIADKKGLSFNALKDDFEQQNITFEITTEKVIFSAVQTTPDFSNMDENSMFQQAQEMLAKMSPEEIQKIQDMYANMNDEEKQKVMDKAKNMGLF